MMRDFLYNRSVRRFLMLTDGASAVELALITPLVVIPLFSVADLAIYTYNRMQVEFAAQATVTAVQRACGFTNVPVTNTTKCSASVLNGQTLKGVIDTAAQSTSMGSRITVANTCSSGSNCWDIESFYCLNGSNKLVEVAGTTRGKISTTGGTGTAASTAATNCTGAGGGAQKPGDYINIKTTYNYTPPFRGISLGSLLMGPITREAWLRVG
jgi:Flp pilus assembly pilin Flp